MYLLHTANVRLALLVCELSCYRGGFRYGYGYLRWWLQIAYRLILFFYNSDGVLRKRIVRS